MIKVRFSSVKTTNTDVDIEIIDGELLRDAFERSLSHVPFKEDQKKEEIFQVLVNGVKIENDFFSVTQLKEKDEVLICPIFKGGDNGSTMRQIAFMAVVIGASFVAPWALGLTGTLAGALVSAGASIAASLAFNALVPPSVPNAGLSGSTAIGESQMYSISSQSNTVAKFGIVPKVYGSHRIFPRIAANPYTELELDPNTGELSQYLYAIYDFGLGPNLVNDIRIGETPISEYSEVQYKIVDFNKPDVSEGIWDDMAEKELTWYKGDVVNESIGVELNGNQFAGDPESEYRAIRNAAINTREENQEITITLANPQGLYGYSAVGDLGPRKINLEIVFSKEDEDDWKGFNDPNFVSSWKSAGGEDTTYEFPIDFLRPNLEVRGGDVPGNWRGYYVKVSQLAPYSILSYGARGTFAESVPPNYGNLASIYGGQRVTVGYPVGTTQIVISKRINLIPGTELLYNGTWFGKIQSITEYNADFVTATLEAATTVPLAVYEGVYTEGYIQEGVYPSTVWIPVVAVTRIWLSKQTSEPFKQHEGKLRGSTIIAGLANIERTATNPIFSTFKFTPKEVGNYKVRVTRISTTDWWTSNVADSLTWVSLATRFDAAPIITDKRHTFLELKIKASGQLNGNISNLSAVCTSVLDTYNFITETWKKAPTDSPAWVFVDLLTGEVNKRAISKDRLHLESILEWGTYCAEIPSNLNPDRTNNFSRFSTNFILDYSATLQTVIDQVCGAAQASLNIIDGKYGVLLDVYRNTPVQVFTPRNSSNFSSSRIYSQKPDAISVQYIDPTFNWEVSEVKVYENGKDVNNAEIFDELIAFGCTNSEQAWRYGRYMLFQNRLRQETMSIQVDFEHLVCTRGDYVQIVQDSMRVGGTAARVRSVDTDTNEVVIDTAIDIVGGIDYGYVIRTPSGIYTSTLTVIENDTFEFDGDLPQAGDLVVIGEVGKIVYDCIVKSISPNDDLSATLVLVEKADGVYAYETSQELPEYDPQISYTSDPDLRPPGRVTDLEIISSGNVCVNNTPEYFSLLDWDRPIEAAPEHYEVYVNSGVGFDFVATTRASEYRYVYAPEKLGVEHTFIVLAVSASGRKLTLLESSSISFTPEKDVQAVGKVNSFRGNSSTEVIQFSWDRSPECGIREYVIKHLPVPLSAVDPVEIWKSSVPVARVSNETTVTSIQNRSGVYSIKAVRMDGVESEEINFYEEPFLNFFDKYNRWGNIIWDTGFPDAFYLENMEWDSDNNCWVLAKTVDSEDPEFREFHTEGYIYSIHPGISATPRLFMLEASIHILDVFPNDESSDFDVDIQYRVANDLGFMDSWPTLDELDPMTEYDYVGASEWRTLLAKNEEAKIVDARVRVRTRNKSITPRIQVCRIRLNEARRVEEFADQTAPSSGWHSVQFVNAFSDKAPPPTVQITIQNPEAGDYHEFGQLDTTGFEIKFFNSSNVQVERIYDATINGYGKLSSI